MQKKNENQLSDDFTQGSITKKLLKFMIPILGALILQAMYGAVDLLVVGRFGSSAGISAVSTGSNIINLVTFVITSLTMGVTVLISRYLGEKREGKIGKVIGGAILFFAVMAVVMMVLLLAGAPLFASWLNAPKEAYGLTVEYVRICGAGIIFVIAYNVISGIFRGLGNSKLPLPEPVLTCFVFSFIGYFNGNGKTLPVMLQGITASFLVRVPFSWLFSLKEHPSLVEIGFAVPLASIYGIIFFTICYIISRKKEKKAELELSNCECSI